MRPTTPRRLARLASIPFAGLVLAGLPAVAVAASPCASPPGEPAAMTATAARADTLCLLNQPRAAHGLHALTLDRRLNRAALGHSRDMVAQRYFAHDSRSGRHFGARIAATGWMDGRAHWTIGENIAWGTGSRASPRAITKAWMRSPGHRHNILRRGFRVVGIGVKHGTPVAHSSDGITYTTDFGS